MSKVKFNKELGEYGYLGDLYTSVFNLELTTSAKTKAVYTDSINGNKLVLLGKDFVYDGADMEGGTITTIAFQTDEGVRLATINKGKWDPQDLVSAYGIDGFDGMVSYVLRGKDTMLGSKIADDLGGEASSDKIFGLGGNDYISGDGGNDKLWGGRGADVFFFESGQGRDTIHDFDAVGGGEKQDYISLPFGTEFTEVRQGKNLLLDFGDGGSILLIGVKPKEFDDADLWVVM